MQRDADPLDLPAGQERSIPAPSEAVQSTKASGDLLRRFKELRESLRNEYSEPPMLTETEAQLRVSALQRCIATSVRVLKASACLSCQLQGLQALSCCILSRQLSCCAE